LPHGLKAEMALTAIKAFVQSKMWMLIALLWLAICKPTFMACSESGEPREMS
jgi:hypothetical protein